MAWLEKADVFDTLGTRISYLRKWVNDQCLNLQKQKKMKKQYLACWDTPNQWGRDHTWRRTRNFFKKKSFNKQRREKYKRKNFQNQVLESIGSLGKLPIVQQGKIIASIGHVEK